MVEQRCGGTRKLTVLISQAESRRQGALAADLTAGQALSSRGARAEELSMWRLRV